VLEGERRSVGAAHFCEEVRRPELKFFQWPYRWP